MIDQLKAQTNMTDTEKIIAQYLLDQGDAITMCAISDVAKATYSSNATIIRLCRKLGCQGFKDFKIKYLRELSTLNDTLDISRPFYLGEGTAKITQSIADLYIQCVNDCRNQFDDKILDECATLILNAKHIFIYGRGDSNIRGDSFSNKLMKLSLFTINASLRDEEYAVSHNVTKDDVALFITYRADSDRLLRCAQLLKSRGCPVILISADVKTPLTRIATLHIHFPYKEKGDNVATFYSQIGFDYILNSLYSIIYAQSYEKHHAHKKRYDTYESKIRHRD